MTCHRKPPSNRRTRGIDAFTFLEVALTLAIIAVAFFAVVPAIFTNRAERQLQEAMSRVTQDIRRACLEAEKSGRAISLQLTPQGVVRMEKDAIPLEKIPKENRLWVRFPEGEWEPATEQILNIYSIGAVVPVSLRIEQGSRWIETDLDFLTGNVRDERYAF